MRQPPRPGGGDGRLLLLPLLLLLRAGSRAEPADTTPGKRAAARGAGCAERGRGAGERGLRCDVLRCIAMRCAVLRCAGMRCADRTRVDGLRAAPKLRRAPGRRARHRGELLWGDASPCRELRQRVCLKERPRGTPSRFALRARSSSRCFTEGGFQTYGAARCAGRSGAGERTERRGRVVRGCSAGLLGAGGAARCWAERWGSERSGAARRDGNVKCGFPASPRNAERV